MASHCMVPSRRINRFGVAPTWWRKKMYRIAFATWSTELVIEKGVEQIILPSQGTGCKRKGALHVRWQKNGPEAVLEVHLHEI